MLTMWSMMKPLGLTRWVLPPEGLETEVSQPCLQDLIKGWNSKTPESCPGWSYSVRLSNTIAREVSIVQGYQERTTDSPMGLSLSWSLPQTSFLQADFNLYPFSKIIYLTVSLTAFSEFNVSFWQTIKIEGRLRNP